MAQAGEEAVPGAAVDAVASERPYEPSLVNRLVDAVRASSVPAPAVYALLALALVAVEVGVKVADGTFPEGFRLIHVILPLFAMTALPAIHAFGDGAAHALDTARPLLELSEQAVATTRYRLTTLPTGPTTVAAAVGLGSLALLTLVQPADTFEVLGVMTSPMTSAVEWSFQVLTWSGVGVTAFLILRQMRLIYEITTHHLRIDLFALGSIYAFSRLTAAHAVFTTGIVVLSSVALSRLAATPQWVLFGGGPLVLAAATFVVPLWGAHRLLTLEKRRHLDGIGMRLERLIAELQSRVDRSDLAGMEDFTAALDGVVVAQREIRSISTWPWQPATLSGVASVLLAPLVIWLITRVLDAIV